MALIDDLRTLAGVLSPSHQVTRAEGTDLLGAFIAYAEHGPKLLEAAADGAQAVADFYHDSAVDSAREAGADEPVKGSPVQSTAATAAPGAPAGVAVTPADLARVMQELQSLSAAVAAQNRPTADDVTVGTVDRDAGDARSGAEAPAVAPTEAPASSEAPAEAPAPVFPARADTPGEVA